MCKCAINLVLPLSVLDYSFTQQNTFTAKLADPLLWSSMSKNVKNPGTHGLEQYQQEMEASEISWRRWDFNCTVEHIMSSAEGIELMNRKVMASLSFAYIPEFLPCVISSMCCSFETCLESALASCFVSVHCWSGSYIPGGMVTVHLYLATANRHLCRRIPEWHLTLDSMSTDLTSILAWTPWTDPSGGVNTQRRLLSALRCDRRGRKLTFDCTFTCGGIENIHQKKSTIFQKLYRAYSRSSQFSC